MKRIFIATKIYSEELTNFMNLLQKHRISEKFKLVDNHNTHITYAFCGNQNDENVKTICNCISEIKFKPFKIQIENVSYFGNKDNIKVVYLGCSSNNLLENIANEIRKKLKENNIYFDEKPFLSHITIIRPKKNFILKESEIKDILTLNFLKKFEYLVDHISVFESILRPQGPEYIKLS